MISREEHFPLPQTYIVTLLNNVIIITYQTDCKMTIFWNTLLHVTEFRKRLRNLRHLVHMSIQSSL